MLSPGVSFRLTHPIGDRFAMCVVGLFMMSVGLFYIFDPRAATESSFRNPYLHNIFFIVWTVGALISIIESTKIIQLTDCSVRILWMKGLISLNFPLNTCEKVEIYNRIWPPSIFDRQLTVRKKFLKFTISDRMQNSKLLWSLLRETS